MKARNKRKDQNHCPSRRKFTVSMLKGIAGVSLIGLLNPSASAAGHYDGDANCAEGSLDPIELATEDSTCGEATGGPFEYDFKDSSCGYYLEVDPDIRDDDDACNKIDLTYGELSLLYDDEACGIILDEGAPEIEPEDVTCGTPINEGSYARIDTTDGSCNKPLETDTITFLANDDSCAVETDEIAGTTYYSEDENCGTPSYYKSDGSLHNYQTGDDSCSMLTKDVDGTKYYDKDSGCGVSIVASGEPYDQDASCGKIYIDGPDLVVNDTVDESCGLKYYLNGEYVLDENDDSE